MDFIRNLTLYCIHLDTMCRNIDILFFMVKFIGTVCSLTKMHFCFGTWKPIFFGPSIKIYHMHEKQVCELTFRLANTYMLGLELGPKILRKLVNWKKSAYILNDTEGAHFPQTWQLLQKSTKLQIVSWFHLYLVAAKK